MKINLTALKNSARNLLAHKYCAISVVEQDIYVLTAMRSLGSQHEVEFICCDHLEVLASQYQNYDLAIAIPECHVITKNWFFPMSFSLMEIYHQIANHKEIFTKENIFTFDLEIRRNDYSDEQLVIGHFITRTYYAQLVSYYGKHGWRLAAIEPDNILQQRTLKKSWQLAAQSKFLRLNPKLSAYPSQLEITLKLLDRENFLL